MTTPPPPRNPEPPATTPTTMARYMWCLRDDPNIKGMLYSVAALHASFADVETGGNIYATQKTMGEKLGRNRQTIAKYQAQLRDLGYLQQERRQGRNVVYRLVAPATLMARYQRN